MHVNVEQHESTSPPYSWLETIQQDLCSGHRVIFDDSNVCVLAREERGGKEAPLFNWKKPLLPPPPTQMVLQPFTPNIT